MTKVPNKNTKNERIKLNNPCTDFQKMYESYSNICQSVKTLKEQIRFLEELTECRSSYPKLGTSTSPYGGSSGKRPDKIADLTAELEKQQSRMLELWEEISKKINSLTNFNQRIIMTERYLNKKKWEQIAEDTNFSERWLMRMHKAALENLG